jgi:hypothetical protein
MVLEEEESSSKKESSEEKEVVKKSSRFSPIKMFAKKHPFFFGTIATIGISSIIGLILAAKYKKLRLPALFWK